MPGLRKLIHESRRRNVLRTAALYLIGAWLIAQVADVVIGLGELPPSIGRAVLIILAIGFPVALVVSWFFEWTPAGIRLDSEAKTDVHTMGSGGRRIDNIVITLLSVALVYFVATHDWQESPQVSRASIAVLPFENRSAMAEDTYFANGIHDDILTQLSKIRSLMVISRTSVMRYRNSDKSIPEIARELGVATILEGGVQRAGERVRVNLQLIDAFNDKHLWAENYDRELTAQNVFAIQSQIATAVADTLHAQLLPEEQQQIAAAPTNNLEAYDAYALGRRYIEGRDLGELTKAREYFERAIELDPDFALAHTSLSKTLVLLSQYYGSGSENLAPYAEQEARTAMDLDPGLGEAYIALAMVMRLEGAPADDYGPLLKRGVELSPGSADARRRYASFMWDQGQSEEALEQTLKAVQLDPMSPIVRVNLASVFRKLGRDAEASIQLERALEIDPQFRPALMDITQIADPARQLSILSKVIEANSEHPQSAYPWLLVGMVWQYLNLRDDAAAEQWLDELDHIAPSSGPTLIGHLNLNLYRGQEADALVYANKLLPTEQGPVTVPSRTLMLYDFKQGNLTQALKRYDEKYPDLLTDVTSLTDDYYMCAIDVAMLLQALGELEKAHRLFDLSLQYMDRSLKYMDRLPPDEIREYGVLKARIYALRGDREEALAALQEAIDAGWRFQWWFYLEQDPAFGILREDPRFKSIANEMALRVRGELETIRKLEASGDIILPPVPKRPSST